MTKYISLGQATAKEQCDNHAEEPEGTKNTGRVEKFGVS